MLFIGDIFGKPGRISIKRFLSEIKKKYSIDFVIANIENSAHCKGITLRILRSLSEYGVDFFTLGNHSWSKTEELEEIFSTYKNIVRPLNLSSSFKYYNLGMGSRAFQHNGINIRITNLIGTSVAFKNQQTNCFKVFDDFLAQLKEKSQEKELHIVDFHSETTSEKNAFLWAFNGQVSAILGTHTHIPTNDYVITQEGTAYISDVGMTGPSCGIIGGKKESIISKFFHPEEKFKLEAEEGPIQLCSVVMTFNRKNYKPISIEPVIIREGFSSDKYSVENFSLKN
ncbi:TIGR00282 family metallophosphoesterase [Mycoplasma parvum]|nr:TIGR00282 family metallophosphoesterase [Mycoplasma parvum]